MSEQTPQTPQEQPATHQPDPKKIVWSKEERLAINRSVHLKGLIASQSWLYIVQISEAIVKQALSEMDAYQGTDDAEIAKLTFIWKTLKAHHNTLINTVKSYIQEGETVALTKLRGTGLLETPETESAVAFPVVKPACDAK